MRREELYLADLIDNAWAVRGYLDGVTREHWDAEDILRDAVLYRMLLLGEIASAMPDDLRDRYPDVAWRQVRAFRNLAVHKYFGVDWAVVWKIAQEESAVLEAQVLVIMRAEYPALAKDYEAGPAPDPDTAVETSPLSIWETRATDTPIRAATCSWVIPRLLRISAKRQPRASSSITVTAASKASWPPAVSTARSRCPESRQRDTQHAPPPALNCDPRPATAGPLPDTDPPRPPA